MKAHDYARILGGCALTAATVAGLCTTSAAQNAVRFSVDQASASVGMTDSGGVTIEDGSILTTYYNPPRFGPAPPPYTDIRPMDLGLPSAPWEVDAFSHGQDGFPSGAINPGNLWFSVHRLSLGVVATDPVTVLSERPESASDLFVNTDAMSIPADDSVTGSQTGSLDGNGRRHPVTKQTRAGLGLVEPADDLDAFDQSRGVGAVPMTAFFSLDSASASSRGYLGSDVLQSNMLGSLGVYAPATSLGLSNDDDLDALAVWDDGDGFYEPPMNGLSWGPSGGDMVLFSVRNGSGVIGTADSLLGLPIEPGDVLTAPVVAGGAPAIVIACERIGLRSTRAGALASDDLNALDVARAPLFDCNGNGVEDSIDIQNGTSEDKNRNGKPDECETFSGFEGSRKPLGR